MRYREFAPHDALSRWIRCYWILEGTSPRRTVERVFPDGCMEMIVHLGEPFESGSPDGTFTPQPRATFHGQLQRFALLRAPYSARTIGIRFQPAGASGTAKLPLHSLRNRSVDLEDLQAGASHELADRLESATTDNALPRALDRFLLQTLDPATALDPLVEHCVHAIERSNGRCRIADLAGVVGLSPRQLERRFDTHVGLTPKTFAMIVRFQQVFRLVEQDDAMNLTQAAIAAGFFDQAHFIRSFKTLTGLAPSRFFREPGRVAPLFAGH